MIKFEDLQFEHISIEEIKAYLEPLFDKLTKADSADEYLDTFRKINDYRLHISTNVNLFQIHFSIDTTNDKAVEEVNYWDENSPLYEELINRFYKIVINNPYKEELIEYIPNAFYDIAKNALLAFDPRIMEEIAAENKLVSKYGALMAGIRVTIRNEEYNLSSASKFTSSKDRVLRKEAYDAMVEAISTKEDEIDDIYDQLVHVRDKMAKKMGYDNYIDLGYKRLGRTDYDQHDLIAYRKAILDYVVPCNNKLRAMQAQRLGLDKLDYYDINVEFKDGNPKVIGDADALIDAASRFYNDLSKETGEFFNEMKEGAYWDLLSKANKQGGGYCTILQDVKMPFIFANFNGTQADVNTLVHEVGHSLQCYTTARANKMNFTETEFPSYEAAEINSMGMEIFAYPYYEYFFGDDADKYRFMHLSETMTFIPYGTLVDAFQHEIYAHPDMSKEDRKATWRKLELLYCPERECFDHNKYLSKGTYWYRQGHIFNTAFYYIDYTIAQVCALEFWVRNEAHDENSFKDYMTLARLGGNYSFLKLLKKANLESPFDPEVIKKITNKVMDKINSTDTSKF